MTEARTRSVAGRLVSLGGRITIGALAVVAIAVGGGMIIGLSPILIGVLAGTVIVLAVVVVIGLIARRGPNRFSGIVTVLSPFALAGTIVMVAIQAVPYGRHHTNPPVTGEPAWSTPRTRELMVDACYDCHSNEVEWPWYTNIAPFSWAVTGHVDEGRQAVNYSEFSTGGDHEAEETIEVILEGSMPPYYYTLFGLHPEADLSQAEITELVAGLQATPGLAEKEE